MEQRDINDELSAAGAQELLTSTSAAHLAYTATDGTPRVIPVGFFWTGDQFVISSATTSPKVTALSARPDVALPIDAGNTPDQARALSVRGRASVEITDGVVPEYLAAARKTMDAEAAAEFEQHVRDMYDQMARIAVTPQLQHVGGQLLHRETKTEASEAALPLPGICMTALRIREKDQAAAKAAAGASWVQTGLVFTTRVGTPFEPRNLNRRFETRCAKAGVRRITVHDMRHTCATLQYGSRRASSRGDAYPAAHADRRDHERLHRGLGRQDAQGAQAAREAAWLVGVAVLCCCTA